MRHCQNSSITHKRKYSIHPYDAGGRNNNQSLSDAVVSPLIREKFLQTIDNFNLRVLGKHTKLLN